MTFDDKLLNQVEANEAWLAKFESPTPDAALLARIKGTVRHAANERWLDESAAALNPAVVPHADAIVGVKAAVRAELAAGSSPTPFAGSGSSLYRLFGTLSAAAMIALALGVIRFAPTNTPQAPLAAVETEDLFLESLDAVIDQTTPELLAIEAALTLFESETWSATKNAFGANHDPDLDDLSDEIENLGAEPYNIFETS